MPVPASTEAIHHLGRAPMGPTSILPIAGVVFAMMIGLALYSLSIAVWEPSAVVNVHHKGA